MSTPYQQGTRIGELTTPLGPDKLVLMRFNGTEAVSELFEFRVEALCEQEAHEDLDFDAMLGKACSVRITTDGQGDRFFTGTLTEVQRLGPVDGGVLYQLIMRPWFWLLSKRANSRIFHNKTVDEIIREVLADHASYADFELRMSKSYPPMEYCVQHRESDLNFLCRLMEQHGIGYFFEFGRGTQKLVLCSDRSGYGDTPGKTRNFYEDTERNRPREEYLYQWIQQRRFTTGKIALSDYNFKEPGLNLLVEKSGDAQYENGELEAYSHPGKYDKEGKGQAFAEAGIDAVRAVDGRFLAAGNCASMAPGNVFELATHHDAGEYLILRCYHSFQPEDFRSSGGTSGSDPYHGNYEFMLASRHYAPPMVTPKPYIAGPQTAKVVGEEEIDCDEYGRIKVHFHWNREDKGKPEHESMWCRVAQVWAGQEWGGIFLPRRDMEVLVNFIDGDPDRPVIVGCVYNQDNMPPYELPSDKNLAGWKSRTVDGGGYNEIALDDTKGSELVRIHGEHDLEATVENDITIIAKHQITLEVGNSRIVMDATSIKLTSMSISINASADLKTNGAVTANHESGGVLVITAPMVKVN